MQRGAASSSLGGSQRQQKKKPLPSSQSTANLASLTSGATLKSLASPQNTLSRVVSSPSISENNNFLSYSETHSAKSRSDPDAYTSCNEVLGAALQDVIEGLVLDLQQAKSSQKSAKLLKLSNFITGDDAFKRLAAENVAWKVESCIDVLNSILIKGRGTRAGSAAADALMAAKTILVVLLFCPLELLADSVPDGTIETLVSNCMAIIQSRGPSGSASSPALICVSYHILGELCRSELVGEYVEFCTRSPTTGSSGEPSPADWYTWWAQESTYIMTNLERRIVISEPVVVVPDSWRGVVKVKASASGHAENEVAGEKLGSSTSGSWNETDIWTLEGLCLGLTSFCSKFPSSFLADRRPNGRTPLNFVWLFLVRLSYLVVHTGVEFFNMYTNTLPPGTVSTGSASIMTGVFHLLGVAYDDYWANQPIRGEGEEMPVPEWFDSAWLTSTGVWSKRLNISAIQSHHSINKKVSKDLLVLLRDLNSTIEDGDTFSPRAFTLRKIELKERLQMTPEEVEDKLPILCDSNFQVYNWRLLFSYNVYREYGGNQGNYWFALRNGPEALLGNEDRPNYKAQDKTRSQDRQSRRSQKTSQYE